MSYAALADFGIKAVMGISRGVIADAQVNAENTVNEANAWANNLVRSANNTLRGARASLQRYNQSVNNQRTLENAGSAAEAAQVNYRRARDSVVNDDFESQIAFAEQAGAQAAASALSGLTGGVADLVSGTTALRKARLQQRAADALKQGDWDAQQRQVQIMEAGWDAIDASEITADIDFSTDVAVKRERAGNLIGDILGGQDPKNFANIGNWAKGKFSFASGNSDVIPMQPGGGY